MEVRGGQAGRQAGLVFGNGSWISRRPGGPGSPPAPFSNAQLAVPVSTSALETVASPGSGGWLLTIDGECVMVLVVPRAWSALCARVNRRLFSAPVCDGSFVIF